LEEPHYKRSESAYALTLAFLKDRGITWIRRAGVSFPLSYIHTMGAIDFMTYEKESDLFVELKEEAPF
jgi:hypothetical protein